MKILYYDCFAGISGDMNLGALLDLGIDKDYFFDEIKKIEIDGYEIKITREQRKGIEGTRVKVLFEDKKDSHEHSGHKECKNLSIIKGIIGKSKLDERVKQTAMLTFENLARAEAKVHGVGIDEIHFHEVGAIDSIIDIVGASICINYLKPDRILSSSVELGGGIVHCQHGNFPVPAPATSELLEGIPVKIGLCPFEMCTPTGAAILKTYVQDFADKVNFRILKSGYGIGSRELDIPNVLRVFLGEVFKNPEEVEESLLECNLDDMNPEVGEYLMEKLFKAGALDVFFTPIIMKKSRAAFKLNVLCTREREECLKEILFRESSTFGIRSVGVKKSALRREIKKVKTQFGEVSVKVAFLGDKVIKNKLEYEEIKKIAEENNMSFIEVESYIKKEIGI